MITVCIGKDEKADGQEREREREREREK